MRIKQRWRFVLMNSILILALLSGCTYGASRTGSPSGMTRLSQTTQELIAAQPGPLAGTHFYLAHDPQRSDIANILDRLPPLVDGLDEAMVQAYGEKLLAQDQDAVGQGSDSSICGKPP
jgi:Ca-activated chloride channel family protein